MRESRTALEPIAKKLKSKYLRAAVENKIYVRKQLVAPGWLVCLHHP